VKREGSMGTVLVLLLIEEEGAEPSETRKKVQNFRDKKLCLKTEAPDSLLSEDKLVERHFHPLELTTLSAVSNRPYASKNSVRLTGVYKNVHWDWVSLLSKLFEQDRFVCDVCCNGILRVGAEYWFYKEI
jgi:hypothetical protein